MRLLDRARDIAEQVLFPAAADVDRAVRVPLEHLDLFAAEGFYGLSAAGVTVSEAARVVEALASGCLATTFVWLQHHGAVRAVAGSGTPGVRDAWFEPLCRGERRAGVVQAALRPGPPAVTARRVDGGYLLSGVAAWVTGWGLVDVLHTAARDESGRIVWLLMDAVAGPTLEIEPLRLVAVNASRTVQLRFADHFVPESRLTRTQDFEGGQPGTPEALRANGSLALGVATRCALLLDGTDLKSDVDTARSALDGALSGPPEAMPRARAAASALAMRAASLLAVGTGARAVLAGEHPQRLVREAAFLLVFGSRPAIREELLTLLARSA